MILTGITLAFILSDILKSNGAFAAKVGHKTNLPNHITYPGNTDTLTEAQVANSVAKEDMSQSGGCGSGCGSGCGNAVNSGGCGGCGAGGCGSKCGGSCGGGGCGNMANCGGCGSECGGGDKCVDSGNMVKSGGCGGGGCGGGCGNNLLHIDNAGASDLSVAKSAIVNEPIAAA